jgi:hypothetical protein
MTTKADFSAIFCKAGNSLIRKEPTAIEGFTHMVSGL